MTAHCNHLPCAESFDPEDDLCVCECPTCVAHVHRVHVAKGLVTPSRLTVKQAAVLAFIVEQIDTEQRPPSSREIATRFGWASNHSAYLHLEAIERKGWISVTPGIARGIKVLVRPQAAGGTS